MKQITANELEKKLNGSEKVNIIDVREEEEVVMGKIPEAKHIPLGEIPNKLDELNMSEHYYIVCRSGGRSGRACEFLIQHDFNVTNVSGGMLAWEGEVE